MPARPRRPPHGCMSCGAPHEGKRTELLSLSLPSMQPTHSLSFDTPGAVTAAHYDVRSAYLYLHPVPPLRRASCASRCTAAHRQGHRAVATRCRFPLGRRPQRSLCPFPTRVSSSSSRRQARFLRHFRPTSPRRRCRSAACDSALRHRSGLILPRARRYADSTRASRSPARSPTRLPASPTWAAAQGGCCGSGSRRCVSRRACLHLRPHLSPRSLSGRSTAPVARRGGRRRAATTHHTDASLPAAVAVAASRMVPLVGSARLC